MTYSLRENLQAVTDPRNLDSTVEEIFEMMLGVVCRKDFDPETEDGDGQSITAVVGFGGLLSGACVFRSDGRAALAIAGRLAGTEFDEIDDTVKDAVGEICNMIAGGWKSKIPELSSNCGLSIPAVITGNRYQVHVQAPEFRLQHHYRFEGIAFSVTIVCDGLK